jgi:hypothetical protein
MASIVETRAAGAKERNKIILVNPISTDSECTNQDTPSVKGNTSREYLHTVAEAASYRRRRTSGRNDTLKRGDDSIKRDVELKSRIERAPRFSGF